MSGTVKKWTEQDERYLVSNYSGKSNMELAQEMGRTVYSVSARANYLGLRKERRIKSHEKEILEMVKAEYTTAEIARKLKFDYSVVQKYLKEKGIKATSGRRYDNKAAIDLGIEDYKPKEINSKKVTLVEWYKHWYNVYRKEGIGEATKVKYRGVLVHLNEGSLGRMKLSKITRSDIQLYISNYGRSRSKQTVLDHMQHIRGCFKDAVLDGHIERNPATNINPVYKEQELSVLELKKIKDKKKWLETEEYQKLRYFLVFHLQKTLKEKPMVPNAGKEQSCQQILYMMIFIALKTGARMGEITGLTINDFLKDTTEIYIDKTWNYKEVEGGFQPTKNTSSVREVLVDDETMRLIEMYESWLIEQGIKTAEGTLFMVENQSFHNSTINDALKRLLKSLEIEPITMHKLRHTQASYLIAKGVPLQVVAKRLGHTDTNMIQRVYGHLLKETEDAGNKMILGLI